MQIHPVTYSKAIAIVLVVLGHAYFETSVEAYVNFIHVPLFYFMAGFCFKDAYNDVPIKFIKKRIKGLYIPFVAYGLLFLILHNLFYSIDIYNSNYGFNGVTSTRYTFSDFITRAMQILSFRYPERLLGGYWFLPSLFIGSILFFAAQYVFRNRSIAGCVVMFSLGSVLMWFNISFYLFTPNNIFAAFIIYVGYIYKKFNLQIHKNNLFIACSIFLILLGVIFWKTSMLSINKYTQTPYLITALCGILLVFGISEKIETSGNQYLKRILSFIGNNTLTILTCHMASFLIISLCIIWCYDLSPQRIAEFPIIREYSGTYWSLLYFIASINICLLVTYFKVQLSSRLSK